MEKKDWTLKMRLQARQGTVFKEFIEEKINEMLTLNYTAKNIWRISQLAICVSSQARVRN